MQLVESLRSQVELAMMDALGTSLLSMACLNSSLPFLRNFDMACALQFLLLASASVRLGKVGTQLARRPPI